MDVAGPGTRNGPQLALRVADASGQVLARPDTTAAVTKRQLRRSCRRQQTAPPTCQAVPAPLPIGGCGAPATVSKRLSTPRRAKRGRRRVASPALRDGSGDLGRGGRPPPAPRSSSRRRRRRPARRGPRPGGVREGDLNRLLEAGTAAVQRLAQPPAALQVAEHLFGHKSGGLRVVGPLQPLLGGGQVLQDVAKPDQV